jgi:hypothetical protein
MMDCLAILAQAGETAPPVEESVVPMDFFWEQVTSLGILEALTFISFGVVCLLYGWRVFKILVVISFGMVGLGLGATLGDKIQGQNSQVWGGLLGLCLMAALAVPLMRWAVSVLGAIAGGLLTSSVWYACGLTEKYIWAGALIGVIAGGMIVVGALALLYLYPETSQDTKDLVYDNNWFLPAALMIPTAVGIIVQNKFIKGSKEWSV